MRPTLPPTRPPDNAAGPELDRIRVLVVDDHPMILRGVVSVLADTADIEVVAEASNGEDAVTLCGETHPHVVLIDLSLRSSSMSGLESIEALHAAYPTVQQIVYTAYDDGDLVQQALRSGALSYVLKTAPSDELINAIRQARRGRPTMTADAVVAFAREAKIQMLPIGHDLTKRENNVLALLVKGWSYQQIADELVVTRATVRYHVHNIASKLHTTSHRQAEIIAVALAHHLVPPSL
jgi:two-component system, NarL family, response regulator LiaR